jgi:hypothetical protein
LRTYEKPDILICFIGAAKNSKKVDLRLHQEKALLVLTDDQNGYEKRVLYTCMINICL